MLVSICVLGPVLRFTFFRQEPKKVKVSFSPFLGWHGYMDPLIWCEAWVPTSPPIFPTMANHGQIKVQNHLIGCWLGEVQFSWFSELLVGAGPNFGQASWFNPRILPKTTECSQVVHSQRDFQRDFQASYPWFECAMQWVFF